MKAELVAIWMVLLVAPKEVDIVINTDSMAAIASLGSKVQLEAFHRWSKCKSYSLITKIHDLSQSKKIVLKFNKIKGHSGEK